MKKTVRKLFWVWDFEKEEAWINEMAAEGWHLVRVGFLKYVFEKFEPGMYGYRMELLEESPTSQWGKEYIKICEDAGIEKVGTYYRWVYWRRKSEHGEFDLYSDLDSRIAHLQRIINLINVAIAVVFFAGVLNFYDYLISSGEERDLIELLLGGGLLIFGYFAVKGMKRVRSNLDTMKEHRNFHE